MKIIYPTPKHRQYIAYMEEACSAQQFSLVLEGSLAHGKAGRFSDIDLILAGNITAEQLEKILTGYGPLTMTNYTENPKGILILNYENGISVDLDLRKTVLKEEVEENMVLCDFGFEFKEKIERLEVKTKLIPERPLWYKTLRLIHRCCLKYLADKTEAGKGLEMEVAEGVEECCHVHLQRQKISDKMIEAFNIIDQKFEAGAAIRALFTPLFKAMKEKEG